MGGEAGRLEGITEYDTTDGIHVLRIHYSADPAKRDPAWIAEAMAGTTDTDWRQEMEIDFGVPMGRPWYPEFRHDYHVAGSHLEPIEGRPVLRGWDYGLTPATIFAQTTAKGQLLIHWPELQSWESGILAHGRLVQSEASTYFPGYRFTDYGDPAGNQRAQTDERTCVELLRSEYGISVVSGPVAAAQRDLPVRKALTTTTADGQPMLLIDPRCRWLISALGGGYQRKEVNGRITEEVAGNEYTHIVDALQYVVSMVGKAEAPRKVTIPKAGRM